MFTNIFTGRCMLGHWTLPTYVQNFRPIPLTGFEIMGFKLKNKNDDDKMKNWRNELLVISPMLVVQF